MYVGFGRFSILREPGAGRARCGEGDENRGAGVVGGGGGIIRLAGCSKGGIEILIRIC